MSPDREPSQREWKIVNRLAERRWRVRVFAAYGPPPGSHIGLWRTRAGELRGVNMRIGRRIAGPCFTVLFHWRRGGS